MTHKRGGRSQEARIRRAGRILYPRSPMGRGEGTRANPPTPKWIKDLFPSERLPYGPYWPEQRINALQRDKFVCQYDGCDRAEYLHVHHIVPFRISRDNSLENLMTLCNRHHGVVEAKRVGP